MAFIRSDRIRSIGWDGLNHVGYVGSGVVIGIRRCDRDQVRCMKADETYRSNRMVRSHVVQVNQDGEKPHSARQQDAEIPYSGITQDDEILHSAALHFQTDG